MPANIVIIAGMARSYKSADHRASPYNAIGNKILG